MERPRPPRPTYPRLPKGPPEAHGQLRMLPRRRRIPPLEECEGQFAVYQFIVDFKVTNDGNGPSLSVIAAGVNKSESVVRTHVTKLMAKGLVRRNEYDQLIVDGVYMPPDVE